MKRPLKIGLIIGGAVLLVGITVAANIARLHSTVRDVAVDIRTPSSPKTPQLVSAQTVKDSIYAAMPRLGATRVADVDCDRVVAAALNVPYIESAKASVSVSGRVVVKAVQRRPIARLFYGNRECYFDNTGHLFPISTMADCNVLVAGGNFGAQTARLSNPDSLPVQMQELITVASFLDSHSDYLSLIDQVYSQSEGNLYVVPKLADIVVELGDADNLDEKFTNLLAFYRNGMPRAGWNTYSRISLKYDGQVVCTKRK